MRRVDLVRHRQFGWGTRGVVFVELAIVLLFLVPLLILTVDLSYALYEYQTLVKQARAGARYLSVQPPGDVTYSGQALSQHAKASCIVRTSTLDCSHSPLLPQLSKTSLVSIRDSSTDSSLKAQSTSVAGTSQLATTVNLVEVRIDGYVHQLFKGLTSISFGPVISVMRQTN